MSNTYASCGRIPFLAALTIIAVPLSAQYLPTLSGQTCGPAVTSSVAANGTFAVESGDTPVTYQISADVHCDEQGHPHGTLKISGLDLNGSSDGVMTATNFTRLTSILGAAAPAAHLSGNCSLAGPQTAASNDCHFRITLLQIHQAGSGPVDGAIVGLSIIRGNGSFVVTGAGQMTAGQGSAVISSKVGAH